MRIARSLPHLCKAAIKRIDSLFHLADTASSPVELQVLESVIARIAIDLQNTWANFSRAYFLSCMLRARTGAGRDVIVPNPPASIDDALGRAVVHYKPWATPRADGTWHRREEPTWHDTNVLLTLFNIENASNLGDVQAALSSGYRVFIDLPVFRNYFAHRNQQTIEAARRAGVLNAVAPLKRPSEILMTHAVGRHRPLLLDWIDDMRYTIEYLCA